MAIVQSQSSRQFILDALALQRRGLLIVSYDAVIAPAERSVKQPGPVAAIVAALEAIRLHANTRLALITDRRAEQVRKLLPLKPSPEIWGCYGLQRLRADGREELFPISDQAQQALHRAASLLQDEGLQSATELRHGSLMVRWSQLPAHIVKNVSVRARRVMQAVSSGGAVILSLSADGIELRAPRAGKASAVTRMLDEFGQGGCAAYIGCDISDEESFRLITGCGIGVLVRAEQRQSAADLWLRSSEELRAFLSEWLNAGRGR
jgi:trehalose 6-phosphate phosphatase